MTYRVTKRRVRWWYSRYNRLYFQGKLPKKVVIRFSIKNKDYLATSENKDTWAELDFDKRIHWSPALVKAALLHEMIHLYLGPRVNHGPRFVSQVRRLAREGALDKVF